MVTKILTVTVGLCFVFAPAESLLAQTVSGRNAITRGKSAIGGLAPTPGERSATGQYSTVALEQFRTQLVDLADTVQQFAALAPSELVDLESLATAKAQIQQCSTLSSTACATASVLRRLAAGCPRRDRRLQATPRQDLKNRAVSSRCSFTWRIRISGRLRVLWRERPVQNTDGNNACSRRDLLYCGCGQGISARRVQRNGCGPGRGWKHESGVHDCGYRLDRGEGRR